jgi:hypothetical protein
LDEDAENHRVLLLALDCVTFREYHHESVKITWEKSDLRRWLNENFLETAFDDNSKRILPRTVHTYDNPEYRTRGGEDAEGDNLFLLSLEEVHKYFDIREYYKPNESSVARLNGATVWWWLRSPGRYSRGASFVFADGSVIDRGSNVVWSEGAVRPAFWLNLQS